MIVAQYEISASTASVVGGTGNEIKFFLSRPVQKFWNAGKVGVYTRQSNSCSSESYFLPFEKINGSLF